MKSKFIPAFVLFATICCLFFLPYKEGWYPEREISKKYFYEIIIYKPIDYTQIIILLAIEFFPVIFILESFIIQLPFKKWQKIFFGVQGTVMLLLTFIPLFAMTHNSSAYEYTFLFPYYAVIGIQITFSCWSILLSLPVPKWMSFHSRLFLSNK